MRFAGIPERALYRWLGAGLFVALNGVVLRTAHHWGDVPWRLSSLLASKPLQAALTLTWTLTALAAMVVATKRRLRPLWMLGAALLAAVVAKLFLVDLGALSGLPRVVAFLGVGVLLLVIGFLSPLPPAAPADEPRDAEAASGLSLRRGPCAAGSAGAYARLEFVRRRSSLIRGAPCPATRSARCSASPPSANRTARRSVASSTAARRDWRSRPPTSSASSTGASPGTSRHVTQRRESDTVEILSGVFEGRTTGTPIALLIRNEDQRSKDYAAIADTFRPGHADYAYWQKYGIRDYRGGGRASARETAVRVAAGAIARKWLAERYGVRSAAIWCSSGPRPSRSRIGRTSTRIRSSSRMPAIVPELEAFMDALRKSGDSCGAKITVVASGVPVGWGEPVYGRLDADLAQAMMGINAVKGVEIGAGFASVAQRGSEHSDEMTPQGFLSNNAGGILGGISTGQDIVVTLAVKPTSSIRLDRRSIDKAGHPVIVNTHGRHDPCVGIRATPIAEAMLALVLMDHALRHRAQNADVVDGDAEDRGARGRRRSGALRRAAPPSTIRIPTKPEPLRAARRCAPAGARAQRAWAPFNRAA